MGKSERWESRIDLSRRTYLTPAEVATYLGSSKSSVYEAIKCDELEAHRFPCIGLRIHVESLKAYIDKNSARVG